jgi:hypothetical protein
MIRRRVPRTKNGGPPPDVRRRKKSVTSSICGWCQKAITKGNAWPGNIEVATWLAAPVRKAARMLCRSCAERLPAMVEPAVQKFNRFRPELRLQVPYHPVNPFMFEPADEPIPNLKICVDFFFDCKLARCNENAGQHIADLLLQFERDYPVEWTCSGWKNDFIAELVLGYTDSGTARQCKPSADYWFSQHWKRKLKFDRETAFAASDKRARAKWAAIELEYLKSNSKSDQIDDHGESYNAYAHFIRWRNKNWELRTAAAVIKFRREWPKSRLSDDALIDLLAAHKRCLEQARNSGKVAYALDPSKVIQEVVARRRGVSSRLMAEVRSQMKKRNARS